MPSSAHGHDRVGRLPRSPISVVGLGPGRATGAGGGRPWTGANGNQSGRLGAWSVGTRRRRTSLPWRRPLSRQHLGHRGRDPEGPGHSAPPRRGCSRARRPRPWPWLRSWPRVRSWARSRPGSRLGSWPRPRRRPRYRPTPVADAVVMVAAAIVEANAMIWAVAVLQ